VSPAAAAVRLYERVRAGVPAAPTVIPFRRLRSAARLARQDHAPAPAEPPVKTRASVRASVALERGFTDSHRDLARSPRHADLSPRRRRGAIAGLRARTRETARPSFKAIAAAGTVVLVMAALLVWIRLQVVGVGYQLSSGRQLEQGLEQEQRELELEIATLSSPRRLEQVARERLGMGPPAPGQIITAP
jgi:cell division protein FtsL